MSSPDPSIQSFHSHSTRNPRRRQRNAAEDGSMRQQPQRKRSKISGESFKSAPIMHLNGDAHKLKRITPGNSDEAFITHHAGEMPVRGKQLANLSRLGSKDDGSVVLTKNPNYVIKQLPALPENIRLNRREQLRASFLTSNGYALVLTHTQALIWDYTSKTSNPPTRIFSLPNPARHTEPIPIGALVSAGSGTDTGLVVINATTGKISFWESIENADALSLFEQRRNGVLGSCGSLLSDEKVVDIENAEHAGFVLLFSTGRTAQLLLRDLNSRTMITVNFLRNQTATSSGGLFGGLKSVFSGANWLKDVVAARAHRSQNRGNMEVIIANENALLQIWQLTYSGQNKIRAEIDAKAAVATAATSAIPEIGSESRLVHVLDFAIASDTEARSDLLVLNNDDSDESAFYDLLVLVKVSNDDSTAYALVELEIRNSIATARRTIPLRSYAASVSTKSDEKCRVVLSQVSETAFVIFDKAIVLVSLATVRASPTSQLLMDAHRLPEPFQDTIHLRAEGEYSIVGLTMEEPASSTRQSSIILFLEKFGVVRVTTAEAVGTEQAVERSRISAKSKIEQAVYFGTLSGNPLDLSRKSEHNFAVEEVESAALEISKEICATDSPFIAAVAPSMEHHLEQRAHLLKQLALNLKQQPGISRVTRWKLRFDAEKMAAARNVWSLYDKRVKGGDLDARLLPRMLPLIHTRYKTSVESEHGERDPVRQWFLKDVWRMENLVAWPWRAIVYLQEEKEIRDYRIFLELLSDACDIILGSLEAAFSFREDSATVYGLEDEPLHGGVLQSSYEGLPECWTSTYAIQQMLGLFINGAREKVMEATETDGEHLVLRIAEDIPRLIDMYCRSADERFRWYLAQEDEKEVIAAKDFKQNYDKERSEMIRSLADLGLTVKGIALAEKYKDMQALVYLVKDLAEVELNPSAHRRRSDRQEHIAGLEKRIRHYFDTYGDEWADAFYSNLVSGGAFTALLDQASTYKLELTRFLKAEPTRKKIEWINDVLVEKDYLSASDALLSVAEHQEGDLWSKKVELSLVKLASLADKFQGHSIQDSQSLTQQANALQLVKLQERLYDHVRPTLYNAVDQVAELQLAMESFGKHGVKGRPALHQLLERGLESLIRQSALEAEQLIDTLTLMDQRHCELKQSDIAGREFVLALQALSYSQFGQDQNKQDVLLKIIYRRCFIRDDWKSFDAAARRSDQEAIDALESTTLFKTFYEGYATDLWDSGSGIRMHSPIEVVGAGTSPDDYRGRFQSADLRQPIAKDVLVEDGILQHYISKCRLTHWVTTTQEWAKERVRREMETAAEHGKRVQEVVSELEGDDEDFERYKGTGNMIEF